MQGSTINTRQCPFGAYCSNTATLTLCPSGSYGRVLGATSAAIGCPGVCPPNSNCLPGSVFVSNCTCISGFAYVAFFRCYLSVVLGGRRVDHAFVHAPRQGKPATWHMASAALVTRRARAGAIVFRAALRLRAALQVFQHFVSLLHFTCRLFTADLERVRN